MVNHSVMSDSVRLMDCSPQVPLSMGFSRKEYWSGLPFPSPILVYKFVLFRSDMRNFWGFPRGASGKEPAYQWRRCKRRRFNAWVRKMSWRRPWQRPPVFLFGESHIRGAWRALVHRVAKGQAWLKRFSIAQHMLTFYLKGLIFHNIQCKRSTKFWKIYM